MFLSIRKFSNVKNHDEVIKKVEGELLPVLRDMPGFISYYATKFENGDLGSIGIYETKANADSASEKAMGWVKQNLAEHLPGEPMVLRGEVLFGSAGKTIAKSA